MIRRRPAGWVLLPALALLAACSGGEDPPVDDSEPDVAAEEIAIIGDNLAPMGEGYPEAGDPCRQLGESDATRDYLDDSALLVGCPTQASADALGGEVVATIDGVRLVSVAMEMGENGPPPPPDGAGDALVAGTEYNATAPIRCGFGGKAPTQSCQAGVKRNWGEPGNALVEVKKPDGFTRALFFDGTTPTGADSAQADGSSGWDFSVKREGDQSTITFGPETYVVVDALVEGG